jgi:hypothetical protein
LVIFIILSLIGRGALIKSADKAIQEKRTNFKEGFREGKKYLWPTFLISITSGMFLLVSIIILVVPISILFYNKAYIAGGLLTVIGILTIIPVIILVSFLKTYGYIYAILGDLRPWAAIESAYLLFRKNIASSIVMGLLFIPINLALTLGMVLVMIPLAVIFLLIGIGLYAISNTVGIIIIVVIALLLFIIISFFLRSVYEVFAQTAWILFFRQIAAPKVEEKVTETIEEKEEEKLPEAEVIKTAEEKK